METLYIIIGAITFWIIVMKFGLDTLMYWIDVDKMTNRGDKRPPPKIEKL